MTVCLVQIGARNHYITAESLYQSGRLAALHTDAYIDQHSWLQHLPAAGPMRALLGRHGNLDADLVRTYPAATALTLLRRLTAGDAMAQQSLDLKLARLLARKAAGADFSGASIVYGYSGASAELFRAARRRGLTTVLDQGSASISTSSRLLRESALLWDPAALDGINKMSGYEAEESEELAQADLILAPSGFVRDSLVESGVDAARIRVLPYGYRMPNVESQPPRPPRPADGSLRLLFVGTVNLQKGVPVLLAALQAVNLDLELRLVGDNQLAATVTDSRVQLLGRLPRTEVNAHYQWADVLVLPSVCEGFGMVQLEALAHGVPVIRSENTGDIARDNREGLVVKAGSVDSLASAIRRCIDEPDTLAGFSAATPARAQAFSVTAYSQSLIGIVDELTP